MFGPGGSVTAGSLTFQSRPLSGRRASGSTSTPGYSGWQSDRTGAAANVERRVLIEQIQQARIMEGRELALDCQSLLLATELS
jgi:hypothetical protein